MPFENKYSLDDYNKAIELHKMGYGSQRIARFLGYNTRNAIEDWINKGRKPYYFSEKRINAINSKENVERMRAMNKITQPKASKMAAELATKRLPENAKIISEDLAYILGVCYGDGHISISQRRVILGVTDQDFALKFKEVIERWSGFNARFFTLMPKPDEFRKNLKLQYHVYIDSKEAADFLFKFNINLILDCNNKTKSEFIKGFFDSEGFVANPLKNKRIVRCFNTKYDLILLIKKLLDSLSIENTISKTHYMLKINNELVKKNYYSINICRKESIINFYNYVGFNIYRKQQRLEGQVNLIRGQQR
jgi:intein-encoded DNA endonuclease-like protein